MLRLLPRQLRSTAANPRTEVSSSPTTLRIIARSSTNVGSRRLVSSESHVPPPEPTAEQCAEHLAQLATTTAESTSWTTHLASHLTLAQRQQVQRSFLSSSAAAAASLSKAADAIVPEPSFRNLRLIALTTGIPFVGFGLMDNAVLIIAGDAIDTSLGVWLGISTMCAAAIGNIISDVAGVGLGTVIEDWCALYLNLPQPTISQAQRQLRSVRFANQFGCAVGLVIGCVLGMFPLFFIDSNKIQARKREKHLDDIFQDVMTEAKTLIGAQRTCLFLLVNDTAEEGGKKPKKDKKQSAVVPTPDGRYLYAKYGASATDPTSDRLLPLGRGIVSRAALTAQSWNISDVQSEPDFASEMVAGGEVKDQNTVRNMVCVPVLDSQGRSIAVIRAVNKVGKGRGDTDDVNGGGGASGSGSFTSNDVQILKALASHISVSLQRMYDANREEEELRLKDTIRILKEYGLEGIAADASTVKQRPLFPQD